MTVGQGGGLGQRPPGTKAPVSCTLLCLLPHPFVQRLSLWGCVCLKGRATETAEPPSNARQCAVRAACVRARMWLCVRMRCNALCVRVPTVACPLPCLLLLCVVHRVHFVCVCVCVCVPPAKGAIGSVHSVSVVRINKRRWKVGEKDREKGHFGFLTVELLQPLDQLRPRAVGPAPPDQPG